MKKKIVVIEDNSDILDVIANAANHLGYEVVTVNTIISFQQIANHAPSLIIVDDWLHHDALLRLYQALRSNTATKYIPVLLLSTNHGIADIYKSWGIDDFLQEPFDTDQLITKMKDMVKAYA